MASGTRYSSRADSGAAAAGSGIAFLRSSRRVVGGWSGCRTVVHSARGTGTRDLLGVLVLSAPGAALSDGGEDDLGVTARVDLRVLPHEAGEPVVGQDVGGASMCLRGVDA